MHTQVFAAVLHTTVQMWSRLKRATDAQTTKMRSIRTVSCHPALGETEDMLRCAETSLGPKVTAPEGQTQSLLMRVRMESDCRQESEWWVLGAQAGAGRLLNWDTDHWSVPETTEVVHFILCTSQTERVLGENSDEMGRGRHNFQRNKFDSCFPHQEKAEIKGL